MAALEHRVLTGILRDRDMSPVLSAGLIAKEFKDPEARQIYQFIYRWWHNAATHKTVPSVAAVRKKWPSFEPTAWNEDKDGSLKSLAYELKMRAYESDIRGLAQFFSDLVDEDPENAIAPLKRRLDDLAYRLEGGTYLNSLGIVEHALKHYQETQDGKTYGIPWPWDPLTQDTMGKKTGELTVFYGRMKSMKTWLMLYCAAMDFLLHNQRVLIWSREMNEQQVALRLASIIAGVDYQLLKKGKLPPRMREKAFNALKKLKASRLAAAKDIDSKDPSNCSDIIILAGFGSPKTTGELRGAVYTYHATVLYADSFYHLRSDREGASQRWQQVAAVAEDLKTIAQDFEIPVIGTAQANRSGEKNMGKDLTEVADADNIGRESDLIIRIIKRRGRPLHEDDYEENNEIQHDVSKKKKIRLRVSRRKKSKGPPPSEDRIVRVGAELALILSGNREGVLEAFTIHAIPGYNFKIIQASFNSEEVKKWVEEDNKKMMEEAKGSQVEKFSAKTFKGMKTEDPDKRKYKR